MKRTGEKAQLVRYNVKVHSLEFMHFNRTHYGSFYDKRERERNMFKTLE